MPLCLFVTDLHGFEERYRKLIDLIGRELPDAVFIGGDVLPSGLSAISNIKSDYNDFLIDFFLVELTRLKDRIGEKYPRIFIILGNDDAAIEEKEILKAEEKGYWQYLHNRRVQFMERDIYGYACIPPSPYMLKDWEKYDVSRFVDPGCISPETGMRTVKITNREMRFSTIKDDLNELAGEIDLARSIWLFHAPPYQTPLDRADLDGKFVDHVPIDPNIGSIAIRRFIENRRPAVTLHGHVHESARLTGSWRDTIGSTHCFSAAHDGPELAVVKFDPDNPGQAVRVLY